MAKLKLHEKILLAVCLLALAGSLTYVIRTRMLDSNEAVGVETFDISSDVYDVTVINQATYEDFLAVKGIGSAKAIAIIEFREALGGFDSVYQIGDLTVISDSLLDAIIEHFYPSDEADSEPEVTAESEVVTTSIESRTEPIVTTAPETTTVPTTTTAEPTTRVTTTTQATTTKVTTTATTTAPAATTVTEPVTTTADDPDEEIIDEEIIDEEIVDDELKEAEIDNSVPTMQPVEINYADAQTIADCLLIDLDIAEEIVSIRSQIGRYTYVHELVLCKSIDGNLSIYEKIKDFVIIS